MKKLLLIGICLVTLFSLSARAQFVEGRYEQMLADVDKAASDSNQTYANERSAGQEEYLKSQPQRYNEMLQEVNAAIIVHYNKEAITGEAPEKVKTNATAAK